MLHIINSLYCIIIALIGVNFLIAFHEFGHFIFAKIFGISTPSFSIGFGPKLISKKIGDTTFSLSAIPFGGYVEIAGHEEVGQGEQKLAKSQDSNSFNVKPYWQKLLFMFGGIMFNLLFAYIAIIGLFAIGMPETPFLYPEKVKLIIQTVSPGSLAEKNKLKTDDAIIAINNQPVDTFKEYIEAIQKSNNKPIEFKIKSANGNIIEFKGEAPLGITGFKIKNLPAQGLISSIKNGITATNLMIFNLSQVFTNIFTKRQVSGLGGPIAIFSQTFKTAQQGFKPFLIFLVIFSIQLSLLNLIPVPILDGGQILFVTIEAIIGRELPNKIRMSIFYACWAAMLLLMLFLSFHDIKRIFFN